MLMYRQMDSTRNCHAMKEDQFPPHITSLVERLQQPTVEIERPSYSTMDSEPSKIRVHYLNPLTFEKKDYKMYISAYNQKEFESLHNDVYSRFNVSTVAPISRTRLVLYDSKTDSVLLSFKYGGDISKIHQIDKALWSEFRLEIREENEVFQDITPNTVQTKVYLLDIDICEIDGPYKVNVEQTQSVETYLTAVSKTMDIPTQNLIMYYYEDGNFTLLSSNDQDVSVSNLSGFQESKKFIAINSPNRKEVINQINWMHRFKDTIDYIVTLYVQLPVMDPIVMDKLRIPKWRSTDQLQINCNGSPGTPQSINQADFLSPKKSYSDEPMDISDSSQHNGTKSKSVSPIGPVGSIVENGISKPKSTFIESQSEDSSLSDGDRTLVEENVPDDLSHISSASHSPAFSDQQLSELNNSNEEQTARLQIAGYYSNSNGNLNHNLTDMDTEMDDFGRRNAYFRAIMQPKSRIDAEGNAHKILKVLVFKNMTVNKFKSYIEPYVQVASPYFKINDGNSATSTELDNSENFVVFL